MEAGGRAENSSFAAAPNPGAAYKDKESNPPSHTVG